MFDSPRGVKLKRMVAFVGLYLAGFIVIRYGIRAILGGPSQASASAGLALAFLSGIAIIMTVLVVLGGYVLLITRQSVESMQIEAGAADAWPPASFAMRDRFTKLGFEQFGSMDVAYSDHTATFAAVLSPDGTTMAVISPAHLTFVSDFGGKLLNTTSQPAGAPTRYELRQSKRHGSPEELWDLHRQGLAVIAEAGLAPSIHTAASAMAAFIAIEEYGKTQFFMGDQAKGLVSTMLKGGRAQGLGGSRRSSERIEAWRDSPYRWEPKVS